MMEGVSKKDDSFVTTSASRKHKVVSFAETATLIRCHRQPPDDDDNDDFGDGWWHESDYEKFRKTSRILARKSLDEESRQWLLSQASSSSSCDPSIISSSSSSPIPDDENNNHDGWWRTYGHSRRGLEGIVSLVEGQHRRRNAKASIRLVLELQSKLKTNNNNNTSIEEELRNVYYHATTWSRTLAWAAAVADAEAITGSDPRPRDFFLRQALQQQQQNNQQNNHESRPMIMNNGKMDRAASLSELSNTPIMEDRVRLVQSQLCQRKQTNNAATTTTITPPTTSTLSSSHTHNKNPSPPLPTQCSTMNAAAAMRVVVDITRV